MKEVPNEHQQPIIRPLHKTESIPYDLLLLADPSRQQIDLYLPNSDVYVLSFHKNVLGALVLYPLDDHSVEIKNVAIDPKYQGKGYGSKLIYEVIAFAKTRGYHEIVISTANSSVGPLYLYQKLGFVIAGVKKNFFTDNYPELIYENGIQAIDLIVLSKKL